jgi:branched-chain amino acid transport system substrate-binding protein
VARSWITREFDGEDGAAMLGSPRLPAIKLADTTIAARRHLRRIASCSCLWRWFVVVSNTAPFRPCPTTNHYPGYLRRRDTIQGAVAAKFAFEELGVTTAATIHDGSLYADKLQEVFANNFTELGGTITAQTAVDPNQTDMSSVLADIATGTPELIYPHLHRRRFIRQAKTTPGLENTKLMGADGLFSPDVTAAAGDDVEGFYVSSPLLSGAAYDEFVAKYQTKFGKLPISIFHAHAYDAYMMIKAAIEKVAVKDADGTLHIGRQALRDAMLL